MGGNGVQSFKTDKRYLESIDLSKPILYIPIAIDTNEHPYPACFEWFKNSFAQFDFKNFVMWTEGDLKGKTLKDFEQFGGIYIGGGNTFKLLKELKEFGTFEILQELAQNNMPIYGGSAGAIIFGRTITTAASADKNEVGLTDLSGFNFAHDFDLWCHYNPSEDGAILEYIKKSDLKRVVAIPENTGLFVTESAIEVIGPGDVKVFENGEEKVFNPGEFIKYS